MVLGIVLVAYRSFSFIFARDGRGSKSKHTFAARICGSSERVWVCVCEHDGNHCMTHSMIYIDKIPRSTVFGGQQFFQLQFFVCRLRWYWNRSVGSHGIIDAEKKCFKQKPLRAQQSSNDFFLFFVGCDALLLFAPLSILFANGFPYHPATTTHCVRPAIIIILLRSTRDSK